MDEENKSDYPVGYKKPPRHTQFKPGETGNRHGRPKKSETFADALTKQLSKKVTVTIGDQVQKVPLLELIAIKHITKAAGGDAKSTAIVLNSIKPIENDGGNHLPELLQQFRSINESRKAGKRIARSRSAPQGKKNGEGERS